MTKNIDALNASFMSKRAANFVPLSPLSFLKRTAELYPERVSLIYGNRIYQWQNTYERCVKLAGALQKNGLQKGEVVTVIAANTPEMFECQFAVAMAGGVLNTVNIRLDAQTIAYIFEHAEPKILIADTSFSSAIKEAMLQSKHTNFKIIDIIDGQDATSLSSNPIGSCTYEHLINQGDANFDWQLPDDEWDAICLNYTSGTGGLPKGVVYHHRGAYLMAMGTIPAWQMQMHPTYLYTVPMFHCNGWGHAWMMTLLAGTVICTRQLTAEAIFEQIKTHKITHFGGAPIILGMLVNAPQNIQFQPDWPVQVMTAGAPPPAAIVQKIEALGFTVMQVYGLTETYGHVVQCVWQPEWDELDFSEQAAIKAQQGVKFTHTEMVDVIDSATHHSVPADGNTIGEIIIRSNTIMKGYHKNKEATEESFKDGFFRSGDLAVRHKSGYIEIKDRLKDIIISGGENISSVELENVLFRHEDIAFAAVVAKKDEKWGETPCAFVEMKPDTSASEADIIAFCRQHLAGFKIPKTIIFQEIPKTSTGKIQKYLLRQSLKSLK
ncbi:AMP-binding protein [Alphaproteobacteria bacterium]|nr:AMP-binding protein [Alphaproteobacteria bacterium]